jgi:hypothetical protein
MKTWIGDILKNKLTGEFYKVKRIKIETVMLEAENTPNKIWLGDKESLEFLYEKTEHPKE